jgi:hypothetical protein
MDILKHYNMKKLLIIPMLFACYIGMAQINSSSIIGNPIKIKNLEFAEKDFPDSMNWNDAKKACTELGNGWRLPNVNELNTLFQNINKISGFVEKDYWSSTEGDTKDLMWQQNFYTGYQRENYKTLYGYARAVRGF